MAAVAQPGQAIGRGQFQQLSLRRLALGDFPFQLALTAYPALLWLAWLLADEAAGPPSP